jgi:thymidylate synthase
MFKSIAARTANDAWQAAADLLRTRIDEHPRNPLGGGSHEVHHVSLSIEDPRQRWVFARRPPINPAFALAEVVWTLRGRSDAAFLTHWNKALRRFVGDDVILHGAYGHRLRHQFGVDQLGRAADALSNSPFSRQIVLEIWDARIDLPQPDGVPVSKDIPCNVISCLKVVDRQLEWLQIIRSNDIFLGVPYDLVQWTTLQEILAGWIGVEIGSYNQVSDSLHVYDRDIDQLALIDSTTSAENHDSIALPRDRSDFCFSCLESNLERLINDGSPIIPELLRRTPLDPGFKNWLILFCAEQYRRENNTASALVVIRECTNAALVVTWERWRDRPLANRSNMGGI